MRLGHEVRFDPAAIRQNPTSSVAKNDRNDTRGDLRAGGAAEDAFMPLRSVIVLGWPVTGVDEVVGALLNGVFVEELCDRFGNSLDSTGVGFAQQRFEFGEHLLNRVEVRTIGRQENQLRPRRADRFADGGTLGVSDFLCVRRLIISSRSPARAKGR
jgi:hypothetical protein